MKSAHRHVPRVQASATVSRTNHAPDRSVPFSTPRVAAQRAHLQAMFGPAIQRVAGLDASRSPARGLALRPWTSTDVRMETPVRAPAAIGPGVARRLADGPVEFGRASRPPGRAGVVAAITGGSHGARVDGDHVVIEGDAGPALRGTHMLDRLGVKLAATLPFERYRIQRNAGGYAVEGKLNPWVLIANGIVVDVRGDTPWHRPADPGEWMWFNAGIPVVRGEAAPPVALRPTTRPHESPANYARRVGPDPNETMTTVYRALRSISNLKAVAGTSAFPQDEPDLRVAVPPDSGIHISAADPTANEPVAGQVGGGNRATQYISTSSELLGACHVAAYDYGAVGGRGILRSPRFWGRVVRIDVGRLHELEARLYDLSERGPHRHALLQEETAAGPATTAPAASSGIGSMSERDAEVLIEGTIRASAIVQTYPVSEVMRLLAGTNAFIHDLRNRFSVKGGDELNDVDRQIIDDAGLLPVVLGSSAAAAAAAASSASSPAASSSASSAAAAAATIADDAASDPVEDRKSKRRQDNASRKKSRPNQGGGK